MKAGWEIKKLGEVCKLYQPKTISVEMLVEDGEYLVYGANGIIGHYNQYNHEDSEVLLTCRGATCGSINISEPYSWINGNAMVVKPLDKNNIKQQFLKYYLISVDWNDIITGAAQPQITRLSLSPLLVPIPPLSEQEQIVAELDLISGIIEKKKQQLKELDSLAQSLFYEMFGNPVENDKGWEVKKLGEVGEIVAGSTPSTTDESNWGGDVNWVTPAELDNQLYYGETVRKITAKASKSLTVMPIGTVLLSTRAPIGKIAITTVPMCCNQGFKNIICNNNINNIFLYYYLMQTMDDIKSLGRGATFKEVSKKSISDYKLFLPPLSLQQEFASRIEKIEKQKELIKQSLAETETLFNSRMDYYFN